MLKILDKKFLSQLLTRKGTKIPLYRVYFDLKAQRKGELSCKAYFHPMINKLSKKHKELIHSHLKEIADIIRDNTNMEELL